MHCTASEVHYKKRVSLGHDIVRMQGVIRAFFSHVVHSVLQAVLDTSDASDRAGPGNVRDVFDVDVDVNASGQYPATEHAHARASGGRAKQIALVSWVSKQVGKLQGPMKSRLESAIAKIAASQEVLP